MSNENALSQVWVRVDHYVGEKAVRGGKMASPPTRKSSRVHAGLPPSFEAEAMMLDVPNRSSALWSGVVPAMTCVAVAVR